MKKKQHSNVSAQTLQKLLEAAFTVCRMHPLVSDRDLDDLIAEARQRAAMRVANNRRRGAKRLDYDTLGLVVHRWKHNSRYLTEDGRPAAIRARGRAPSIEALFRETKRFHYFEEGLKQLIRLGQIKKTSSGAYLPREITIIVPTLTPEFFDAVAQTIQRLVATVLSNTSAKNSRSSRLIERITFVPDLSRSEVGAFQQFARDQGALLINTMDNWLESRRSQRNSRGRRKLRGVTAGLHVFAFVENS